jgi:hypothetical protein
MENLTKDIESKIDNARKLISYKTSKPYKNKVLKAQQ